MKKNNKTIVQIIFHSLEHSIFALVQLITQLDKQQNSR